MKSMPLLLVTLTIITLAGIVEATAGPCPSGLVWRDRFEGDGVCVPPSQRWKMEDGTCRAGYVWRDSFPGDGVCVTPARRAAAKAAAAKGSSKPPGKPSKAPSSGGAGSDSEYCPNGKTKEGICFF